MLFTDWPPHWWSWDSPSQSGTGDCGTRRTEIPHGSLILYLPGPFSCAVGRNQGYATLNKLLRAPDSIVFITAASAALGAGVLFHLAIERPLMLQLRKPSKLHERSVIPL